MTSGNNQTYSAEGIDILELLPQQPPFVMVDKIAHIDPVVTVTELTVRPDNFFAEGEEMSAYGMIENVAQTCAARIGFFNYISGGPIKIGFIGAISKMQILRRAHVGEVISTTIEVKEEVFSMTLVSAHIMVGNECLLCCDMKIALSNIDAA